MQVFWREDEPDYLLHVNLFVSKVWFCIIWKNRDKPFATHRLFTHAFHLLFCISEIQNYGDCFLWNILFDKTTEQQNNFTDNDSTVSIDLSLNMWLDLLGDLKTEFEVEWNILLLQVSAALFFPHASHICSHFWFKISCG